MEKSFCATAGEVRCSNKNQDGKCKVGLENCSMKSTLVESVKLGYDGVKFKENKS